MKKLVSICLIALLVFCMSISAFADEIIGKGLVTGSVVNIRSGASLNSNVLTQVRSGDVLDVYAIENDWVRVIANGKDGYIFWKYIEVRFGEASRSLVSSRPDFQAKADQVSAYASKFLGTPYVYGGSSPSGFDCSGFVKYVYANSLGITLNRVAQAQSYQGSYVSKSNLLVGDLVFFGTSVNNITHVGIYTGDGKFIHSPVPGKSVCYDSLNSGYYASHYVTARRVIR